MTPQELEKILRDKVNELPQPSNRLLYDIDDVDKQIIHDTAVKLLMITRL